MPAVPSTHPSSQPLDVSVSQLLTGLDRIKHIRAARDHQGVLVNGVIEV